MPAPPPPPPPLEDMPEHIKPQWMKEAEAKAKALKHMQGPPNPKNKAKHAKVTAPKRGLPPTPMPAHPPPKPQMPVLNAPPKNPAASSQDAGIVGSWDVPQVTPVNAMTPTFDQMPPAPPGLAASSQDSSCDRSNQTEPADWHSALTQMQPGPSCPLTSLTSTADHADTDDAASVMTWRSAPQRVATAKTFISESQSDQYYERV